MTRLAAITGATGFLGRHALAALAREGWRLRLLVRRDPALFGPDAPAEPVEIVPGRLADAAALEALVAGADAVIHLAGATRARDRAAFMRTNRDGTATLARAWADRAPGARFVLASSLAAREPGLSAYAASKAAGEAALAAAATTAGAGAPGAVVLRPAAVYGPGDTASLPLFRAAGLALQPALNGAGARVCLIHARDVAAAVAAAADPAMPAGTYGLSDARRDGYAWSEILSAAAAAAGRPARPVRVPAAALRLAGWLGDAAALAGGSPMLTSGKRREILHRDWSMRSDAPPPAALWHPRVEIGPGFAETLAWYRAAGWLPPAG